MSDETPDTDLPDDECKVANVDEVTAENAPGADAGVSLTAIERQLSEIREALNSHSESLQTVEKRGESIANMLSRVTQSQNLAAGQIRKFAERVDEQANVASQSAFRIFLIDLLRYYDLLKRHSDSAAGKNDSEHPLLMLRKQMDQLLASHQIEAFAPEVGQVLDSDSGEHEAIQEQQAESPNDHRKIVDILRRGYRAGAFILRPAQVVVAIHRPETSAEQNSETPD